MQFLLIAYDGTDEGAMQRRTDAREAHLALIKEMKARGEVLVGAALTDDKGKMIGSIVMVNMPDRKAVDAWLAVDPYVTHKVWQKMEIKSCNLAPSFQHLLTQEGKAA